MRRSPAETELIQTGPKAESKAAYIVVFEASIFNLYFVTIPSPRMGGVGGIEYPMKGEGLAKGRRRCQAKCEGVVFARQILVIISKYSE